MGQVTLSTQSVDYGGGRGARTITNVINWTVDSDGYISFSQASVSGSNWYICGNASSYGVTLKPQVRYSDTWVDLDSKFHSVALCSSGTTDTKDMSTTLINQLGRYKLSGNCSLRFLYYANAAPAPTAELPNAFPDSSSSAAVQVPVSVDVSWTATLKYNANGGQGAPSNQTATTSSNSTTITVSSTIPTREGYKFSGWSYSNNTYKAGDKVTISKSTPTVTLTAIWEAYYRPGEVKEGEWLSTNRQGGVCEVKIRGKWTEMTTVSGGVATDDPPSMKEGKWYNMRKVGKE